MLEMQLLQLLLDRSLGRFSMGTASRTPLANLPWDIRDKPMYLRSLGSEKWLEIQRFANFNLSASRRKPFAKNIIPAIIT